MPDNKIELPEVLASGEKSILVQSSAIGIEVSGIITKVEECPIFTNIEFHGGLKFSIYTSCLPLFAKFGNTISLDTRMGTGLTKITLLKEMGKYKLKVNEQLREVYVQDETDQELVVLNLDEAATLAGIEEQVWRQKKADPGLCVDIVNYFTINGIKAE